jgi:hypothetical protein
MLKNIFLGNAYHPFVGWPDHRDQVPNENDKNQGYL